MGSLYRSEEMSLCQLFLQAEAAYACVSELGELGLVQFRDLNPTVNAFQRKFVNEVRRCEEMERKLRFLEKEIKKDGIPMLDTGDVPDAPAPREMIDLEATFEKLENEMKEVNSNAEALKRNYLDLTELKHILRKTQSFFDEAMSDQVLSEESTFGLLGEEAAAVAARTGQQQAALRLGSKFLIIKPKYIIMPRIGELSKLQQQQTYDGIKAGFSGIDLGTDLLTSRADLLQAPFGVQPPPNVAAFVAACNLGFVAGVILRERIPAFERMLWRACRGNVFLKQAEIETPLEDPVTGDQVNKSVFIIFFQGDQLRTRVKKICEGFRAILYPCPETQNERREMSMGVMTRIEDLNTVLSQTQDHRHRVLVAAAKNIKVWFIKVRKIKAIYHMLNMFNLDVTQKCLISECWCPENDLEKIQMALRRGTERSGSSLPSILNRMETKQSPPTYHKTNKFTEVFQAIVDSYGVATYREVNPAPFAIISFPFLFSLMFGDAGHGVLMFLAALWMVKMEKKFLQEKSDNEIWNIFFGGRYIILLMGGFSMYAGLMYNDVYSKSLNIFGSSWFPDPSKPQFSREALEHHKEIMLDPTNFTAYDGSPYPFGMDPVWQMSSNKISWLNSFKMKISVTFGISQMLFGVVLSLQNHNFFNDSISIFCEFLPQMIFLLCIFGYLIILIFYKWIAFNASLSGCAPSLLIDLINMFLYNYPTEPCSAMTFYSGQKGFQTFLLLIIAACVPWLLLTKPYMLRKQHLAKKLLAADDRRQVVEDGDAVDNVSKAGHSDHGEEFDFGEIFVHQCIHTIEYCLGCISHTASYLRLWALSLAHAELSEVLWNMVFRQGLAMKGYIGVISIFIIFAAWACLTVTILLLMEGLSAFLHTLRLHWVEFQSKFYKGEGYLFEPFRFDKIIEGSSEEVTTK